MTLRKSVCFFYLSLQLLSTVTALFEQERFASPDLLALDDRDLISWLRNVNLKCDDLLSSCEAALGGNDIPAARWIADIEKMDNEHANELIPIVEGAAVADFTPIVQSANEGGVDPSVLRQLLNLQSLDLEEQSISGIQSIITTIIDFINAILSATTGDSTSNRQNVSLIIFVLKFVVGLLLALPKGPIGIIIFIVTQVFSFVTTFGIGMGAISLSSSEDTDCMAKLMECEFRKMMLNVLPASIALALLAEGVSPETAAAATP